MNIDEFTKSVPGPIIMENDEGFFGMLLGFTNDDQVITCDTDGYICCDSFSDMRVSSLDPHFQVFKEIIKLEDERRSKEGWP